MKPHGWKKLTAMLLCFAVLLSLLPIGTLQASAYSETDIAYPVEGGNIYFGKDLGIITGADETITSADIPAEIDGVAVTRIGDNAFYGCDSLTSVTIPDSVTTIGGYAFSFCASLTSVTIGDIVTIGGSVTTIGEYAFEYCDSLTSVTIGDSVTTIGYGAFYSCDSLTSVTIPDSVTTIGEYAFEYCDSLTSVTIGDSVTTIGYSAFQGTAYYRDERNWENDVLYVGKHLIEARYSISGEYIVRNNTLTIADRAFYSCDSLTSVIIPDSVTSIGYGAFSYCDSLTGIWVDESNQYYSSDEYGILFNKSKTELIQCPDSYSGEYTIPDSVTSIGDRAFFSCVSLTSVTIGDSVTSIGDWAFEYCTSLMSVTIGDSVTSIGDYAF
ncbi:MAG: leucine-rich repeat domain-containing protein, partial [Ruminococcaceae bacterium]|nr:leucine-rich repeat domain-containing protein [Oscillospiraceae bacterium]